MQVATWKNQPTRVLPAQLLARGQSDAAAADIPSIGQSKVSEPTASASNPSDSVNLSAQAKAILARAQQDQIAADKLQAFLQSAKNPEGASRGANTKPTSDNGTQLFDQLMRATAPKPGGTVGPKTMQSQEKISGTT
jgi:hypothetical protein